ncbi:VOC family protein, partial [Salmonella enterica subsp. enterica]
MKDVADLDDLVADMPRFVAALSAFAEKLQLDLSAYHADHISLRCHQNTTADRWRKGFEQCASLLNETEING